MEENIDEHAIRPPTVEYNFSRYDLRECFLDSVLARTMALWGGGSSPVISAFFQLWKLRVKELLLLFY